MNQEIKDLTELLGKHLVKREKFVLPTFSGNSGKHKQTPYFEWRYMVKKAEKVKKDSELELLVFNSLTSEARTRFIRLESEQTSFKDIIIKFDSIYQDSTNLMKRVQKLHEIKQSRGESVVEFIDRLETCTYWVTEMDDASPFYKTEAFLKSKLSDSLIERELADKLLYMIGDPNKTFIDYRNQLLELEKRSKDFIPVKSVQPIITPEMDHIARLEEKLDKLMNMKTSATYTRSPNTGDYKKKVRCWRCNILGHVKKDCKVKLDTGVPNQGN